MVAYLSKSDASVGFDQIVDFLNAQVIQYALMVNSTIYVFCIKDFWTMVSIKKANDVVKLRALVDGKRVVVTEDVIRHDLCLDDADGVECLPKEEIFTELARMGYENPLPKLTFLQGFLLCPMEILDTYSCSMYQCKEDCMERIQLFNDYTSSALTQKVFANMRRVGKGFSGVKTPLFAIMLVQPQADVEEDDLEQDKIAQALEILKLKQRVKKLEKKRKSKSSGLKRLRKVGGRIEAIDADEDITMVDVKTQVDLGVELQGRKDDGNAAIKDASDPTVFDDEEVTMNIAQTLINMKAEKTRLLNEQMAKRLHDEEKYEDKQENIDWNVVVEQIQEKNLENIRKYQSLKRKQIFIAQARKNMIVYLKNMAGYKMEYFKGMTYKKVRPIFEREYNKVQTLFKPNKDEEPTKKRVVRETLLQESFKKLKVVKVLGSHSTQDILTDDPKEISKEDVKNMLEIIPVTEFKIEALQRLVKEKFSSAVPTVDKEKELRVELKRLFEPDANDVIWKLQRYMHYPIMWKLHSNCGVHQVSSTTRSHDMYMLTEKDYPLSNGVMTLMLSTRLQVKEDSEMARDLVMKIFIKANQPKSRSLDTSSK
nr:hypothetical protein [Tanacetum cinerariifolium]